MNIAGFTLLVLWIAVSNLVMGFALAVFSGLGPQRLPQLRGFSLPKLRFPHLSKLRLPELPSLLRSKVTQADVEVVEKLPVEAAPAPVDPTPTVESTPADEIKLDDDSLSLELALAQFQADLSDVRDGVNDVDERARACSEAPTVERLEECVSDLRTVGTRILDEQAGALEAIEKSAVQSETDALVAANVRQAADAQAQQIRASLESIDKMAIDAEHLEAGCQRLIAETSAMVSSCQTMDSSVADAQAQISGEPAERLEQIEASAAVDDYWADDPQHRRPMTMAMIDIDGVGELNDTIGRNATDQILQEVEKLILSADCEGGNASQINAQRFLLLLPNASAENCCEQVEALRTAIESLSTEVATSITASGAVAMARRGDTAQSLVARAEATLSEAKQFGRNRTFLNEGEFAKPYSTSKMPSISTEILPGSEPMPTALLAPTPASSPNI